MSEYYITQDEPNYAGITNDPPQLNGLPQNRGAFLAVTTRLLQAACGLSPIISLGIWVEGAADTWNIGRLVAKGWIHIAHMQLVRV